MNRDAVPRQQKGHGEAAMIVATIVSLLVPAAVRAKAGETAVREIQPAKQGPNWAPVDISLLVMAGSRGKPALSRLSALRLSSGDGSEIPYLLMPAPSSRREWTEGSLLPFRKRRSVSDFELDLGETRSIDAVRLSGLPSGFLKRVRVEGSGDRSHYLMLVQEGTLFDLPEEGLRNVSFSLSLDLFTSRPLISVITRQCDATTFGFAIFCRVADSTSTRMKCIKEWILTTFLMITN